MSKESRVNWPRRFTVPCVERRWLLLVLLTGCGAAPKPSPAPAPRPTVAAPAPARPSGAASAPERQTEARSAFLPEPVAARNWAAFKQQMAERLMLANGERIYRTPTPPVLLAVPVLQVELHANGHIKRISVLREPRQAKDTIELARQAVQRAAPFGEMRHLPAPWVFTESFLFDDQRRFKPRSLDGVTSP